MKRIIATTGIVILVLLYIITLIAAITTSPQTPELFKGCVAATIIVPVFIYGYLLIYKVLKQKADDSKIEFPEAEEEVSEDEVNEDDNEEKAEDDN